MVVNIAFYENAFFTLNLLRTREFTPHPASHTLHLAINAFTLTSIDSSRLWQGSKHKIGRNSLKVYQKLETQSIRLKFWPFVLWAKTNLKLFLIRILITWSSSNKVPRGQNDCLSFKLKWQDVAKCLECWYFAQNTSWQYCIWIKLELVDTYVYSRNNDVSRITHLHNKFY